MPVQAIAKGVRISPRKVGVVASLVRGRSVADALTILEHTPRASAIPVKKVIESAKANADYNHRLKPDTLMITEISVTRGPVYKRFRPAARGRALPYQLKSSHIRVIVDGEKRSSTKLSEKVSVDKPKKPPVDKAKMTQETK